MGSESKGHVVVSQMVLRRRHMRQLFRAYDSWLSGVGAQAPLGVTANSTLSEHISANPCHT